MIERQPDLRRMGKYQTKEDRIPLIDRISKIIQFSDIEELVDETLLEKLPVNSIDPLHLAGDCLRDALREMMFAEEQADITRGWFICLRQTAFEDNRDRHLGIASR